MIDSEYKKLTMLVLASIIVLTICSACSSDSEKLFDGYYMAEADSFDSHGWKEFISIYVNNNKIITVEYNAKNPTGFIKSWDMDYMRRMNASDGNYPNKYTRTYARDLLIRQNPSEVVAVTGATDSWHSFRLLAKAALEKAQKGDKNIAFVDLSHPEASQ